MSDKEQYAVVLKRIIQSGFCPNEITILLALLFHADYSTGEAFPSLPTLSRETTLSKVSLIKHLKVLEEKGVITRIMPVKGGVMHYWINPNFLYSHVNGGRDTPVKNFNHPSKDSLPPPLNIFTTPRKASLPEQYQYNNTINNNINSNDVCDEKTPCDTQSEGRAGGAECVTASRKKSSGKTKKQSGGNEYSAEFEEWYAGYPNKKSKAAAARCFARLLAQGVPLDELTSARDRYSAEMRAKGTAIQYIMHPSTFLGINERWKDYTGSAESVSTSTRGLAPVASDEELAFDDFMQKEVFNGDRTKYINWCKAGKPDLVQHRARFRAADFASRKRSEDSGQIDKAEPDLPF